MTRSEEVDMGRGGGGEGGEDGKKKKKRFLGFTLRMPAITSFRAQAENEI